MVHISCNNSINSFCVTLVIVMLIKRAIFGNEETQLTKLLTPIRHTTQIRTCTRATSRATSSVGVMYRFSGPNTESNSGGGQILKKREHMSITFTQPHFGNPSNLNIALVNIYLFPSPTFEKPQ